jgi:hypothetical protein
MLPGAEMSPFTARARDSVKADQRDKVILVERHFTRKIEHVMRLKKDGDKALPSTASKPA